MVQILNQLFDQLATIVTRVGPVEVVDVLLVAFILYQFLRIFRGTQAIQLIVGLVVLVIVGVAASALKLVLLSWLFQNAAPSIVLAIIVLFQPELRRILDQVGRIGHLGRPLGVFSEQQLNRAVLEVVRAVERLAARRTGALVVFEREVGLEDYAATGVRINGEVSSEFLQTIFFPNSPLHDGAVIIRGNQILAAGCLLPLPEEGTVRERLGTRHRAAIGLSLASDALIVVVSEETGIVSVVQDGRISRNLDPEALRRRLAGGTPVRQTNGRRFTILSWLHEVRAR